MASVLFMDFTVVKQSVTFNKPLQLALSLNDENELYQMPSTFFFFFFNPATFDR